MKFLYRPLDTWIITQYFGEDKACISNDNKTYVYKEQNAVCPVGFRSMYSQMKGHNGIDVHAKMGMPLYAACSGIVKEIQPEPERGLGIGIVTKIEDTYYKHRYWHLQGINVKLGQTVETGDCIGWADNTGYSTGSHLHLELKECDKYGNTKNNNNGYFGAIDPMPFMFDIPASRVKSVFTQARELIAKISEYIAERVRK